ncbi:hypothetical protein PUMCH_002057 [Australozyma saopauloensis]|uniref:Dolichyl-phosphate-mannose--protein mannosyltransferase n=1 Tax=Australozyma saopauloensis TaxID=291208 RepID=A0AAX4H8B6_9ASCO|nr:hypothetical protein PUMCH_002057 [[Candida] saopauloensis]
MSSTLKKRGKKGVSDTLPPEVEILHEQEKSVVVHKDPESYYWLGLIAVTAVAAFLRFRILDFPNKVVFDEVHFGKFASYYLEGTYFFDLHPPFAKLLIAFAGWLVGYNGAFKFDNIGDSYIENNVPYMAFRIFLAVQGTAVVPIMFLTMKTLKFSALACVLSASIVAFDNAQVIDSRLILLDATLILSVALTIFTYAKFSTYRQQPFSKWWWTWLLSTGLSLSCVISTKYVGVFTYFTIGLAVVHELWILLDIKKGLSLEQFAQHFFARFFALILMPFAIYLYWFYLHFSILSKSGPGDSFMSSDFQETLEDLEHTIQSKNVNYYDIVTIEHKDTQSFLYSHDAVWPLRYEDGRISSNLQQVLSYKEDSETASNDINSQWEILPTNGEGKGQAVYTNDVVRLRHVGTGGILLTHDVASPLKSTNEEFIVVHGDVPEERYQETLFRLRFAENGGGNEKKRKLVKTKSVGLRFVHVDTVVAMWTHDDELLPDWGLEQQEVSGSKKVQEKDNTWIIDSIVNLLEDDARAQFIPKIVTHIPFLKKWWELQGLMFLHNNQLSSEHPFASQPDSWPLAMVGVSFWNDNDERKQIFFIGNIVGFWFEVGFLCIYVGYVLADLVTSRRDYHLLTNKGRSRLQTTLGFLFAGWALHYFPFFLMNRQKFLHHYLPAHLIAALFTGGFVEFMCTNHSHHVKRGIHPYNINKRKFVFASACIIGATAYFFWYTMVITYGNFTLAPEEIKKREWFDIVLHYTK